MNTREEYSKWLNHKDMPSYLKDELKAMNDEQITDAFYKNVEFGTAGMRGLLGAGTNRLNIFTVRRTTVGFGLYLIDLFSDAKERGVVISHDNRFMSREFTLDIAKTLNKMGINTYILMPKTNAATKLCCKKTKLCRRNYDYCFAQSQRI